MAAHVLPPIELEKVGLMHERGLLLVEHLLDWAFSGNE
jgi:hypothetical protein